MPRTDETEELKNSLDELLKSTNKMMVKHGQEQVMALICLVLAINISTSQEGMKDKCYQGIETYLGDIEHAKTSLIN